MPVLDLHDRAGFLVLDEDECRTNGAELRSRYMNATPFPHIVLDDFVDPALLRKVIAEFPSPQDVPGYNRDQERLKYEFGPKYWGGATTHNLFALFNSQAFVSFLEEMTGFDGLIPDPTFFGGGLHETKRGGHLSVHADFNVHNKLGLIRRLNLLLYLNDDWTPGYGGSLELWDKSMKAREVAVAPVLGRAVVFTTALDSYHGHPDPLACPPDRSRRSMALYYYTSPREGLANIPSRTTLFQVRPGSTDKNDWLARARHNLISNWVPPGARRLRQRLRPGPKRVG
jgi:Rps23 Pro-64 3,4-dihydroxylase Tpa1-like proline 4-hydroxylase